MEFINQLQANPKGISPPGRRRQSILLPMHNMLQPESGEKKMKSGESSMNVKTRPSGHSGHVSPKVSSSKSKMETPKLPDRITSNNIPSKSTVGDPIPKRSGPKQLNTKPLFPLNHLGALRRGSLLVGNKTFQNNLKLGLSNLRGVSVSRKYSKIFNNKKQGKIRAGSVKLSLDRSSPVRSSKIHSRTSKTVEEDKHKFNIKSILKPYYLETRRDKEGNILPIKRSITPDKLLAEFDPLPCKKLQKKMDYFYLPYNQRVDYAKYMRFPTDPTSDYLAKLKFMYSKQSNTKDRMFLSTIIRKIQQGELEVQKADYGWSKIYDLVMHTDPQRKMNLLEQFHKIQDHNSRRKVKRKKKKRKILSLSPGPFPGRLEKAKETSRPLAQSASPTKAQVMFVPTGSSSSSSVSSSSSSSSASSIQRPPQGLADVMTPTQLKKFSSNALVATPVSQKMMKGSRYNLTTVKKVSEEGHSEHSDDPRDFNEMNLKEQAQIIIQKRVKRELMMKMREEENRKKNSKTRKSGTGHQQSHGSQDSRRSKTSSQRWRELEARMKEEEERKKKVRLTFQKKKNIIALKKKHHPLAKKNSLKRKKTLVETSDGTHLDKDKTDGVESKVDSNGNKASSSHLAEINANSQTSKRSPSTSKPTGKGKKGAAVKKTLAGLSTVLWMRAKVNMNLNLNMSEKFQRRKSEVHSSPQSSMIHQKLRSALGKQVMGKSMVAKKESEGDLQIANKDFNSSMRVIQAERKNSDLNEVIKKRMQQKKTSERLLLDSSGSSKNPQRDMSPSSILDDLKLKKRESMPTVSQFNHQDSIPSPQSPFLKKPEVIREQDDESSTYGERTRDKQRVGGSESNIIPLQRKNMQKKIMKTKTHQNIESPTLNILRKSMKTGLHLPTSSSHESSEKSSSQHLDHREESSSEISPLNQKNQASSSQALTFSELKIGEMYTGQQRSSLLTSEINFQRDLEEESQGTVEEFQDVQMVPNQLNVIEVIEEEDDDFGGKSPEKEERTKYSKRSRLPSITDVDASSSSAQMRDESSSAVPDNSNRLSSGIASGSLSDHPSALVSKQGEKSSSQSNASQGDNLSRRVFQSVSRKQMSKQSSKFVCSKASLPSSSQTSSGPQTGQPSKYRTSTSIMISTSKVAHHHHPEDEPPFREELGIESSSSECLEDSSDSASHSSDSAGADEEPKGNQEENEESLEQESEMLSVDLSEEEKKMGIPEGKPKKGKDRKSLFKPTGIQDDEKDSTSSICTSISESSMRRYESMSINKQQQIMSHSPIWKKKMSSLERSPPVNSESIKQAYEPPLSSITSSSMRSSITSPNGKQINPSKSMVEVKQQKGIVEQLQAFASVHQRQGSDSSPPPSSSNFTRRMAVLQEKLDITQDNRSHFARDKDRESEMVSLGHIIRMFENRPIEALDRKNKEKPVLFNMCSKGHAVFTPELISRGKILLPQSPQSGKKVDVTKKFRVLSRTKKIVSQSVVLSPKKKEEPSSTLVRPSSQADAPGHRLFNNVARVGQSRLISAKPFPTLKTDHTPQSQVLTSPKEGSANRFLELKRKLVNMKTTPVSPSKDLSEIKKMVEKRIPSPLASPTTSADEQGRKEESKLSKIRNLPLPTSPYRIDLPEAPLRRRMRNRRNLPMRGSHLLSQTLASPTLTLNSPTSTASRRTRMTHQAGSPKGSFRGAPASSKFGAYLNQIASTTLDVSLSTTQSPSMQASRTDARADLSSSVNFLKIEKKSQLKRMANNSMLNKWMNQSTQLDTRHESKQREVSVSLNSLPSSPYLSHQSKRSEAKRKIIKIEEGQAEGTLNLQTLASKLDKSIFERIPSMMD